MPKHHRRFSRTNDTILFMSEAVLFDYKLLMVFIEVKDYCSPVQAGQVAGKTKYSSFEKDVENVQYD
jgi:hypothetical protein